MLTHRGNPREDHCSPPAKNLTDTLTRYSHQVFMLVKLDEGMKALPQGKGGGKIWNSSTLAAHIIPFGLGDQILLIELGEREVLRSTCSGALQVVNFILYP